MNKIIVILLLSLIVIINVFRFYEIDEIPAGYHVDEYSMASTTRCFGLEGINVWGRKDGAFFDVAYGTPKPATYVWPGALIGRIFGFTVPNLRIFSAFGVVLGVLGIFMIARMIAGVRAGLWAALSASLTPHIFVISRIGFEPLFASVFLVWALFLLLRSDDYKHMIAAGALISLSAYSYPPARLFLPLFLIMYFFIFKGWKSGIKPWCVFFLALIICSLPLIHGILTNEMVVRRFREISIFGVINSPTLSPQWLKDVGILFWHNFALHLDPHFLFIKGDVSAVHSTTRHGLFSYLDYAAWFLGISLIIAHFMKRGEGRLFDGQKKIIVLCVLGYFLAIVPAALTISAVHEG